MIRRTGGVDWLTITAEGQPFGAVINTQHISNVRWQPNMSSDGLQLAGFQVVVELVTGTVHALSFEKQEDAQTEYFRIGNELRGSVIDETVMEV